MCERTNDSFAPIYMQVYVSVVLKYFLIAYVIYILKYSDQEDRVGKCCALLLPWPQQSYN